MSNGQSKAPYIIICSGRIDFLAASTKQEQIQAASNAARNLVVFYGDRVTAEDTGPISDLQHEMMDNMSHTGQWTKSQTEAKVDEMFALLDALEEKFEHHEY